MASNEPCVSKGGEELWNRIESSLSMRRATDTQIGEARRMFEQDYYYSKKCYGGRCGGCACSDSEDNVLAHGFIEDIWERLSKDKPSQVLVTEPEQTARDPRVFSIAERPPRRAEKRPVA